MDAKTQQKAKEEVEAQSYKFRPRVIKAEDVLEGILSSLTNLDSDENVARESDEKLIERELYDMNELGKQGAKVDEEWNLIPESILHSMVKIHNDLFGSRDLSNYGVCNVKVEVRLQAFVDSYEFGIKIMKGLWFMVPFTSVDDELVPEHFLRVCLEHEKTIGPLSESFKKYNFYKDSNASEMFAMVEALTAIRNRVEMYLIDWPDHPGLEKVLDVTRMLLAVSPATPLSKALLGLQLLVRRAELLQESISRFSFNDLLQQVYVVIAKWQKLELECWPTLLEGVLEQHEMNAAKLWFPLRSVLHRNLSRNDEMERLSTLQSIEEFIQTSSLGEFKRRLHLILAFHGQIHSGMQLNSYSREFQGNLNILYNSFGYYMQFLPLVVDHIASERKSIEKDLKDQLKLFHWEHPQKHLSLENFKRTRHKIWKLVQKFNEILQQPVMVILNKEAVLRRDKVYTWLEEKVLDKKTPDLSHVPLDLMQLSTKERFLWFSNLKDIATSYLANMQSASSSFTFEGSMKFLSSERNHRIKTIFEESWILLGNICRSIDEFAHIYKCDSKSPKKRRALRDLLKVLEESGLSRHKSMILELEHQNQSRSSFEQPSYDILHLLLKDLSQTIGDQNANASGDSSYGVNASSDLKWKDANACYFKNLYLVQQVRQICLNFHKDLTLELVRRAFSFLEHLIIVQQEQRSLAYSLFEHLKKLGQQMDVLGGMQNHNQTSQGDSGINGKTTSVAQNQNAVSRGMWWQKNLLDNLISMSKDVLLLLDKGQSCHIDACNIVNVETDAAHVLLHKFIPMFVKAKESVDQYLLGTNKTTSVIHKCKPMLVTKEMEQSVTCNFQTISAFTEEINQYLIANPCLTFKNTLLNRVKDLVVKGKKMMDAFQCELEAKQSVCQKNDQSVMETFTKLSDTFSGAYQATNKLLIDAFSLLFIGPDNLGDYAGNNITSWKCILKFLDSELNLNQIYDSVGNMIMAAGNLANFSYGRDLDVHSLIEACVKNVYTLLNILLTFGERILAEFLDVHCGLTMMTNVLAQIFMVLVSKGYGCAEEPTETTASDASQEATGTGMGEGEGTNDVSDQLDDEAQLLGTSEKNEGLDNSNRLPSDKDKGVEMDEDFPADTFSISEGSDNDNSSEDDEDMNIESKMGNETDGTQTVAEKPWDNDQDNEPNNSTEKYESGPSVKEIDTSSRELRAKEDDGTIEESEELDHGGADMLSEEEETEAFSDNEITDDKKLDKTNAYEDPSGAEFQSEDFTEDKGKDETQMSDMTDAVDSDSDESDEEINEQDEKSNPVDHVDDNSMHVDQHPETKEEEENAEMAEEMDMEPVHSHKENFQADKIESFDQAQGGDAAFQENEPLSVGQEDMQREMSSSEKMNRSNNLAPSRKSPSGDTPNNEITIPDSSGGLSLASDKLQPLSTEHTDPLEQKLRPNPYRSLGDAMEEWKERVNVSYDLDEQPSEALPDIENENAAEYRYVSEAEKGTSQARGSAMLEQVKDNPKLKESEQDGSDTRMKEKDDKLDVANGNSETHSVRASHPSLLRKEKDDEVVEMVLDEDTQIETAHTINQINRSGDIVSFKSSYMTEKIDPVDTLHPGGEPSKVVDVEERSDEGSQNSMAEWKRYEMSTTKLSQELAEQLRLVLEPTLASKLQGDYKTGKRINMKKVIPYIASHFRKDKIWLRRTRPNKRDYQVVVAIDDSRSMSEGHVGNVAIEALVTVCRAMSQLEVGQLAVASFGDKENIKMLHEFDQPFTEEAGAKMISSLSFKHDNQHAHQPVATLLEHLNKMLDGMMVERARIPSGHNPLNQLILIIADGLHFNESRDLLKRHLRDVLSSRRMIAYIIVDSAKQSIMDQKMVSYETGKPSLIKTISTFPFPYYIVLKNIEALPRTLADLLRQWFELMQNSNE